VTGSLSEAAFPAASVSSPDHDQLLNRCLAGEESAYVAVYNEYAGQIYRLCYSLLQNQEDAEEVLQDAFEYAFRKLDRFDSRKASFKTWLYQIAISRCRNKRRRKRLFTMPLTFALGQIIEDNTIPTPVESLDMSERQRMVWKALGELSPKLRETAVLRYYEGFTYSEIGKILSIPAKTAESRMRLAHKALRKLLQEEGKDEELGLGQ
jgi:RNA polymerase sigma-70 factor (ECF subfamily)